MAVGFGRFASCGKTDPRSVAVEEEPKMGCTGWMDLTDRQFHRAVDLVSGKALDCAIEVHPMHRTD